MNERPLTPQHATGTSANATITGSTPIPTYAQSGTVKGCDECNRDESKPWPIFTVNYHGIEVCAKCLTPMSAPRSAR